MGHQKNWIVACRNLAAGDKAGSVLGELLTPDEAGNVARLHDRLLRNSGRSLVDSLTFQETLHAARRLDGRAEP